MNRGNRYAIAFLCCVLAMPTCVKLLPGFESNGLLPAVFAGVLLGIAHLLVRPIIRVATAPIGCLTLGLIQPLIDMGLIYACDRFAAGFSAGNIIELLLAVVLINATTFIAAGRR